jgi:YbgC/YbaW family acyl-CoA thioester hydrolase
MAVQLSRRVDWPMLDIAGVVYYPQYWDLAHRFFEEAWPEICGVNYPTLTSEHRLGFPTVSNRCEFIAPLKYGDEVNCTLWLEEVGQHSCRWAYRYVDRSGKTVWNAEVVTVCVDLDTFEKRPLPDWLAAGLRSCRKE